MKLGFILLTALLITLSSCAARFDLKSDVVFDPAETLKEMDG